MSGFDAAVILGDLLQVGGHTIDDLGAVLGKAGLDIFVVTDLLRQLFDRGLLETAVNLQ